jgi:hypothetical protein
MINNNFFLNISLFIILSFIIACNEKRNNKESIKNDEQLYEIYKDSFSNNPNNYNFLMAKVKYMLKAKSDDEVYLVLKENINNSKYDFYYFQARIEKKNFSDTRYFKTINQGVSFYKKKFQYNNDTLNYLLNKYLLLSLNDKLNTLDSLNNEAMNLKLNNQDLNVNDLNEIIIKSNKTELRDF